MFQRLIGDVTDEETSNDWFSNRREWRNSKMKIMSYRYQHAGGLFDERPDDFHSLRPSFKMAKTHFIFVGVYHFFRPPRHRNIPAPSRHPDHIPVRAPFQVTNVTIVG